ncbi:MAG TPA: hypothetical protein VLF67_00075 [Candidatus Saccharimonas sp.]|nr:hypothetical protein [Candidatus Saccharimonas sp.]
MTSPLNSPGEGLQPPGSPDFRSPSRSADELFAELEASRETDLGAHERLLSDLSEAIANKVGPPLAEGENLRRVTLGAGRYTTPITATRYRRGASPDDPNRIASYVFATDGPPDALGRVPYITYTVNVAMDADGRLSETTLRSVGPGQAEPVTDNSLWELLPGAIEDLEQAPFFGDDDDADYYTEVQPDMFDTYVVDAEPLRAEFIERQEALAIELQQLANGAARGHIPEADLMLSAAMVDDLIQQQSDADRAEAGTEPGEDIEVTNEDLGDMSFELLGDRPFDNAAVINELTDIFDENQPQLADFMRAQYVKQFGQSRLNTPHHRYWTYAAALTSCAIGWHQESEPDSEDPDGDYEEQS